MENEKELETTATAAEEEETAATEAAAPEKDSKKKTDRKAKAEIAALKEEVERLTHALEEEKVFASTGSACSSKKMKVSAVLTAMGMKPREAEWALRFSLSPYTTFEEIDYAAKVVKEKYEILKRFQRR